MDSSFNDIFPTGETALLDHLRTVLTPKEVERSIEDMRGLKEDESIRANVLLPIRTGRFSPNHTPIELELLHEASLDDRLRSLTGQTLRAYACCLLLHAYIFWERNVEGKEDVLAELVDCCITMGSEASWAALQFVSWLGQNDVREKFFAFYSLATSLLLLFLFTQQMRELANTVAVEVERAYPPADGLFDLTDCVGVVDTVRSVCLRTINGPEGLLRWASYLIELVGGDAKRLEHRKD